MTYEFQGALHRTSNQAHRACAGEWLSAGGTNHEAEIMQALAAYSDAELATECAEGWGMDSAEWFSIDDLRDAFANIRSNPAESFGWEE